MINIQINNFKNEIKIKCNINIMKQTLIIFNLTTQIQR